MAFLDCPVPKCPKKWDAAAHPDARGCDDHAKTVAGRAAPRSLALIAAERHGKAYRCPRCGAATTATTGGYPLASRCAACGKPTEASGFPGWGA